MDSIALHAHVLSLLSAEGGVAPDRWVHDLRDGTLTYRFGDSPNSFSWRREHIDGMDVSDDLPRSAEAAALVERWEAIERMLDAGQTRRPDRLLVDHTADEMTLVWEEEKLVVIVGDEADEDGSDGSRVGGSGLRSRACPH